MRQFKKKMQLIERHVLNQAMREICVLMNGSELNRSN